MPEEKKTVNVNDHGPKRNLDSELWDKVQQLSQKDNGKNEAIDIIFKQQYKLPEDNITLIKKLAEKEQPNNVRLHIAKNLEKHDDITKNLEKYDIPYGMYVDLFKILSKNSDPMIKKCLENTSIYKLNKSLLDGFKKIQSSTLVNSLKLLSQKYNEITKTVQSFSKVQNTEMIKQIAEIRKMLKELNINKIQPPKISFKPDNVLLKELVKSKHVEFSADVIITKAAEINSEIKESIETKNEIETANQELSNISDSLKSIEYAIGDVKDNQNEQHAKQIIEHQKTRDELSIDNKKLQKKIDVLQKKVNDSWKEPRNCIMGFVISFIVGLGLLVMTTTILK